MNFDSEGHIQVSPNEVHQLALTDPRKLIQEILIPGTPWAFPTHQEYCRFTEYFAGTLSVHPRNLLIKGSTKIGFSIAPRPNKVWRKFHEESDLDLAIIDPHYYDKIDEEVRVWEREPLNKQGMLQGIRLRGEFKNRALQRGRYRCLRYFDLPLVPTVAEHNECLLAAPVQQCCGHFRTLTAFVFRDWWGIYDRYAFDVDELARKLGNPALKMPAGGLEPLPHDGALPELSFSI